MAVNLKDVSERVFHVDHPVRLLARIVVAGLRHAFPATGGDDALGQFLDVRVLHAEVENAGFPVLEVVGGIFLVGELKQLNPDAVAGGQVGDAETAPA